MKNLKPVQILLIGSIIATFEVFISQLVIYNLTDVTIWWILLISLLTGVSVYFCFYFLIKRFIIDRVKVLYRSIRKGKFDSLPNNAKFNNSILDEAESDSANWAIERVQEISNLKSQANFRKEFIGNLAHELKTPVFSIQGYILTLLEGGLEDESVNRKFLERASKATERMTLILEDLDQLTKLETNQFELDKKHFDIHELVQDVFEELEIKAKKKKIKLGYSKDFDRVFVYADKAKIAQVLTNIIGNSISYGVEGGQTIVRFYSMDDIITIEVSDNGVGIAEDELPRLFERFYRVEKSRNRNEGGSGLGLAIVKKIIVAHGQTINVRSTPKVGSTFTFSLDKGRASKAI